MNQGSRQSNRTPVFLQPDYFKIDNRSLDDLLEETLRWARAVKFTANDPEPDTDWSIFFEEAKNYLSELEASGSISALTSENQGSCPPQAALFLTFLKLFTNHQKRLNSLVSEHLNYFFQDILDQPRKTIKPDRAYVFFDLARTVMAHQLKQGTALLASAPKGKLEYHLDRDLYLNKSEVVAFKAINNPKIESKPIFALPVANSMDGMGKPLPEGMGWYPFGDSHRIKGHALLGFGIASNMLLMSGGTREIRIVLHLVEGQSGLLEHSIKANDFLAQVTGPNGWFSAEVTELLLEDMDLIFVLQVSGTNPAIVGYQGKIHGYDLQSTNAPMAKIIIEPFAFNRFYQAFHRVKFSDLDIEVKVENLTDLKLSNDFGDLDASKSFAPFGFSPGVGDNFYASLEEVASKPVNSYQLTFNWKGKPNDLKIYYEGYKGPTNSLVNSQDDFRVSIAIGKSKTWHSLVDTDSNQDTYPMFEPQLTLRVPMEIQNLTMGRSPDLSDSAIRITLAAPEEGFGHTLYPSVYAKAVMTQIDTNKPYIPNEPYTPMAESLKLGYRAKRSYNVSEAYSGLSYFHIEPFGLNKIYPGDGSQPRAVDLNLISTEYNYAGHLYLGIANVNAPQQLSLFFEIQEDLPKDKPEPEIYYLGNKGWQLLSGNQILSDSTLGFIQTGIVLINLPGDMAVDSDQMPKDLSWIRISVFEDANSFDRIMSVRTNGVSCTLNGPVDANTEINSLPPGSINAIKTKIASIKKVHQPYYSFGGRPAESRLSYITRVSEKLRHKTRGVSTWDIERIILEQFTEIFQVKCIPHSDQSGRTSPGNIHIILVPRIKKSSREKVLKPTITSAGLSKIKSYIDQHLSEHVQTSVTNPQFQEITVVARVNFHKSIDAGLYIEKLQEEIQFLLSPWAFGTINEIRLGSTLYRSSIIDFIESRPYVNFILSIELLVQGRIARQNKIVADARTINVSADHHRIIAVNSDAVSCQSDEGIGQMIIDINLDVQ